MRMWKYLLALSLVCSGMSAAASAADDPEVEDAYRKGLADWERFDIPSAMAPLKKASDGGHAEAQALYAYILDQSDEDAEAAKYYEMSAKQGNVDGLFGLAAFYASGDGGKSDPNEARRLFTIAAEKGHEPSITVLASAYLNATLGLSEADKASPAALTWLIAAAKLGHLPSLQRLVPAYRTGELGLAVDVAEADRLQERINKILGFDPNAKKKRRRR